MKMTRHKRRPGQPLRRRLEIASLRPANISGIPPHHHRRNSAATNTTEPPTEKKKPKPKSSTKKITQLYIYIYILGNFIFYIFR